MKSLSWIVIVIVACLNMAGCSEDLNPSEKMPLVKAELSGGLNSITSKAGETGYKGVLKVADEGNNWVTTPDYSNTKVIVKTSSVVTESGLGIYLMPKKIYNFYSIATDKTMPEINKDGESYPMVYGLADNTSVTGDIIYASHKDKLINFKLDNQVALNYNHLYSQVRFTLVKGKISQGNFDKAAPSLAGHAKSGLFNVKTAATTLSNFVEIPTDVTKSGESVEKGGAYYMIPQEFTATKPLVFYVSVGKYIAKATIKDLTLLRNTKLDIKITVNLLDGLNIDIDDWVPGGDVDNEVGNPNFKIEFGFEISTWDPTGKDDVDNIFGDESKLPLVGIEIDIYNPDGIKIDNSFGTEHIRIIRDEDSSWDDAGDVDNEFKNN